MDFNFIIRARNILANAMIVGGNILCTLGEIIYVHDDLELETLTILKESNDDD